MLELTSPEKEKKKITSVPLSTPSKLDVGIFHDQKPRDLHLKAPSDKFGPELILE